MTSEAPGRGKASALGEALRRIRKERGWRLSDLAELTGFPISTLSKIENGHLSLSYDKLVRLSQRLGVDIALLFSNSAEAADGGVSGRRSITRWGEGEQIHTRAYNHLYPASDLVKKSIVPIIAELRARSLEEFGELIRHPGEEFAIVLEGACVLHTEIYRPLRLERGDSVYFDSNMGHAYLAADAGPCWLLSVCSATEPELMEKLRSADNDTELSAASEDVPTPAKGRAPASSRRKLSVLKAGS